MERLYTDACMSDNTAAALFLAYTCGKPTANADVQVTHTGGTPVVQILQVAFKALGIEGDQAKMEAVAQAIKPLLEHKSK
jgi:hypothetical protein